MASVLCAGAAHVGLIALVLFNFHTTSAPSPGADARQIEVVMLPAWPEPGELRDAKLGNSRTGLDIRAPIAPDPLLAHAGVPLPLPRSSPPLPHDAPKPSMDTNATSRVNTSAAPAIVDVPPNTPSAGAALWEGEVIAKLASVKRYPVKARLLKIEDTVLVRLTIDRAGRVLAASIDQSRGYALLDSEAQALVMRASPLPAPPADLIGETVEVIAPINFVLRRGR